MNLLFTKNHRDVLNHVCQFLKNKDWFSLSQASREIFQIINVNKRRIITKQYSVAVANFKNGKLHGEYTEWHCIANLKLRMECHYKNGLLHGKYKEWRSDSGKLYLKCYYVDDVKEGRYTTWHINGDIWVLQNYKNGKAVSV